MQFDVLVIGAGSGLTVSAAAADRGLKVAVVEEGPFGGTCLNRGCIPSKMLIHPADLAEMIRTAGKHGLSVTMKLVDYRVLVQWVSRTVDHEAKMIEAGNREHPNITVFKGRGTFVGPKTLRVGNKTITAKKVVIAAGTRPSIVPLPGLEKTPYLTSTEALRLTKQPKTMIVLGGGYIASELAHFFGALGTKVTVVQRNVRLLPREDKAIGEAFTKAFQQRHKVLLQHLVESVSYANKTFTVVVKPTAGGAKKTLRAEQLLVALGRIPNTDILDVAKMGVKTDTRGYVVVNKYMETSVKDIWALGDIAGKYFFKHSANLEAASVAQNVLGKTKKPVDYTAMPHAIFTTPQIAGVGMTEEQLQEKKIPYRVGRYEYKNTGMGLALREDGFVKVLASPQGKILGCHILGPEASTLIHEVLVAMKIKNHVSSITNTVHIHPALSEVVVRAFSSIEE
ncbi:MAG: dihydrolipoyl dehydrogenase [Nanoarchaeota archaeon]|nr:dihydrolipoyl dehydrogenase [Nanoarchaeota archaeon]